MIPPVILNEVKDLAKRILRFTRSLVPSLLGMTLGIVLLFFPLIVIAQQVSLSISPPIIEAVMKPGKSIMIAYTLKNNGDPVIINSKIVNFEPSDNFGNIKLGLEATGPVRFSLDNADLQLGQAFFLETGKSQQLLLRIRIPDRAPNGDYYYSLLAQTERGEILEGVTSSGARATIASNILITVTDSGIIDVQPRIARFDILSKIKIFDSFDKIPVVLYVENRGNNLIKPEGQINLRGTFGGTAEYDIIPKNILSRSQRLVEATPSANLTAKAEDLGPTSLVLSGFFVGKYNLTTNISFGENSPTVFESTSFFAFPFKIAIGLIITVAATVFITRKYSSKEED